MDSAPRDGTPVELCCTYGVAPWYGMYAWLSKRIMKDQNGNPMTFEGEPGWVDVNDNSKGVSDEAHLHWRLNKTQGQYIDPTGGAQNTPEYWRKACGL